MENLDLKIKLWAIQGIIENLISNDIELELSDIEALKISTLSISLYGDIINNAKDGKEVVKLLSDNSKEILRTLVDDVLAGEKS